MQNKELTHWKKLHNPDYLGSWALQPNEEPVLTIASVGREMVTGADGKKEECTVIHFKEKGVKPMIMNATNSKTIYHIYSTPYVEEWIGKRIQIYSAKIKVAGEQVDALRIRPKAPVTAKPELTPEHEKWDNAIKALSEKTTNIEAIKKHFSISKENEALLKQAILGEVGNA